MEFDEAEEKSLDELKCLQTSDIVNFSVMPLRLDCDTGSDGLDPVISHVDKTAQQLRETMCRSSEREKAREREKEREREREREREKERERER